MAGPVYFEEPRAARWLFGSSQAAWLWLIVRLWLGWEWLAAGWGRSSAATSRGGSGTGATRSTASPVTATSAGSEAAPSRARMAACTSGSVRDHWLRERGDRPIDGPASAGRLLLVCRLPQVGPRQRPCPPRVSCRVRGTVRRDRAHPRALHRDRRVPRRAHEFLLRVRGRRVHQPGDARCFRSSHPRMAQRRMVRARPLRPPQGGHPLAAPGSRAASASACNGRRG